MKTGCFLTAALLVCTSVVAQTQKVSLAGEWSYRLDPADEGVAAAWYASPLDDSLQLPGSLTTNGIGNEVDAATPWVGSMHNRMWYNDPAYARYRATGSTKVVFWLSPEKYYRGVAWYQKKVNIPRKWKNRRVTVQLERCHWTTSLWVDGRPAGSCNSLSVPHRYELTDVAPGEHLITVRVDNRATEIAVGPDAHSVSDNTQGNWNGMVGTLELEARPEACVDNVRIEPLHESRRVRVTVAYDAPQGKPLKGRLRLQARLKGAASGTLPVQEHAVTLSPGGGNWTFDYNLADCYRTWDEFQPNLYELTAELDTRCGTDVCREDFGLRRLGTDGTQITVNGRPVFLRGTLECCIFPKTGYPPTDKAEWLRIMNICRAHGLNHIRFHSWCPPEAAFCAADETGMYLYVECGAWAHDIGSGLPVDSFVMEESRRIVREYGNHPSFCLFSYGNEPGGKKMTEYLRNWVNYWKAADSRFLYTAASGWPAIAESDWLCLPAPRIQGWGEGLRSIINGRRPSADYDWRSRISKTQPTVSHEIGQWCVYPDLKERAQYTGAYKALNFDIFEDRLRENGLFHLADSFLLASGKLQTLCYKADIEAALRTPGFAGFQLLDLHDFPGQGTALVGVLNPFWESKGYVTPQEYSEFCNAVVPLVRLPRYVYTSGDTLRAPVELAQYAATDLQLPVSWQLLSPGGRVLRKGTLGTVAAPTGRLTQAGELCEVLHTDAAQQLQLVVRAGNYVNRWNLWLYPAGSAAPGDVLVTSQFDAQARQCLDGGGKVLLTLKPGSLKVAPEDRVQVGFSSIFWNTLWTGGQAPHTLGILCNPEHPALKEFPTSYHSDYQWWDAMHRATAIPLRRLGHPQPIVRIIDDWFTARSLGLIVEARVGRGSLMLCGADLTGALDHRPEARQLLTSLLHYMQSDKFRPSAEVTPAMLAALF